MGLILRFRLNPTPWGHHTDHGLPAGMNVNVLDCDLLLALAAMVIERIEQHGVRPGNLVGLAQVLASPQTSARQISFFTVQLELPRRVAKRSTTKNGGSHGGQDRARGYRRTVKKLIRGPIPYSGAKIPCSAKIIPCSVKKIPCSIC